MLFYILFVKNSANHCY